MMTELIAEKVNRLLLYAKPGEPSLQSSVALVEPLIEMGLIGETCHGLDTDYTPGDRFMELITFLGCSPDIALSPQDGENYCFVRIHEIAVEPVLYSAKNTGVPRCRRCQLLRQDWQGCGQADYCDQCSLVERSENLLWRKQGALSRWVIEVMNIYPHEALPSSVLLEKLKDVSGINWGYAYLQG